MTTFNEWGMPVDAVQDYPESAPTGTLRKIRKPKGVQIQGGKVLLIAGGVVAGIVLLSNLLGGNSQTVTDEEMAPVQQAMEVTPVAPEVTLTNLPNDLSTLSTEQVEGLLHESWQEVERAHTRYLEAIASVEEQVARQRAQDWGLFAYQECNEINEKGKGVQCINGADYLQSRLADAEDNLARLTPTGTLPLNKKAITEFREQVQVIRDIGSAIYLGNKEGISRTETTVLPIMQARQGLAVARAKHEALKLELQGRINFQPQSLGGWDDEP